MPRRPNVPPGTCCLCARVALPLQRVVVPASNLMSRTTVLNELSDFGFRSVTALNASYPATPIKPPTKVLICNGKNTLEVAASAVAAQLAHGAYLGSCKLR